MGQSAHPLKLDFGTQHPDLLYSKNLHMLQTLHSLVQPTVPGAPTPSAGFGWLYTGASISHPSELRYSFETNVRRLFLSRSAFQAHSSQHVIVFYRKLTDPKSSPWASANLKAQLGYTDMVPLFCDPRTFQAIMSFFSSPLMRRKESNQHICFYRAIVMMQMAERTKASPLIT